VSALMGERDQYESEHGERDPKVSNLLYNA
jgi:hypothetical protein